MITTTIRLGYTPHRDTWDQVYDRIDERELLRGISRITGRVNRVIIDMGTARFPLVDPDIIRQHLPKGIEVEITGSNSDTVTRVANQLDPPVTIECRDCVGWLPCPTHMAAS